MGGGAKTMGRPKAKVGEAGPSTFGIMIRGTKAWREWVNALAEFRRMRATDMIDQSLVEYAERHGFDRPAPKR